MKKTYKAFSFGLDTNGDYEYVNTLLNVTLNNDMYEEEITGDKTVIEEKIPGRDIPYFYYNESSPLEFEVNFMLQSSGSFSEPHSQQILKDTIQKLISPKDYKVLTFGDYINNQYISRTPNYKVIFSGSPKITYLYNHTTEKYEGYFTLTARCNAPYGFYFSGSKTITSSISTVVNKGDLETFPTITITVGASPISETIYIANFANSSGTGDSLSAISFTNLAANEVVTISGNLKTISSNLTNIYTR
jgi:hypothetical protein